MSAVADVIVARVDQNGSCAGLLSVGERILYLNATAVSNTSDVHAFMAGTLANQTLLVTTNRQTTVVRLGGQSVGKLGIGITNTNREILYQHVIDLNALEPPPPAEEDQHPSIFIVYIAMCSGLVLLFLSTRLHRVRGLLIRMGSWMSEEENRLAHVVLLFGSAVAARVAFSAAYFIRFGPRAANVLELWFYVDVAAGNRYFLNRFDPTIYVLRFFALLSPEKMPFYSTVACSIALASLVPVLLYFLVRDLHGPKAGFLSGFIYAFLVQPLALSTVSFTHHIVQIPLSVALLIFVNRAIKSRGRIRLAYVLGLAAMGILGYLVNVEILAFLIIGYVAVGIAVLRWLLRERGLDTLRNFGIMMLTVGLCCIPISIYVGNILSFTTGLTAKESLNATNLQLIHEPVVKFVTGIPLHPVVYLRFYGPLLALLPLGVYVCWKERDIVPYLMVLGGFILGLYWTRGTRILDLGLAAYGGMALARWERRHFLGLVTSAAAISLLSVFSFSPGYLQPYLLAGLVAVVVASLVKDRPISSVGGVTACVAFFLAVSSVALVVIERPQSSQAEFDVLRWLGENSMPGERVLTSLDRGHLPRPISGLESVSDEYDHRPEVAKAFFEPEDLAALTLCEHNVTYVMVSSQDFAVSVREDGKTEISLRGYVMYQGLTVEVDFPFLLAYQLTHGNSEMKFFEEIRSETSGGVTVRLYRVRKELVRPVDRIDPALRTTLSSIIRNPGALPVRAWMPVSIINSMGSLRGVDSIAIDLPPGSAVGVGCDYEIAPRSGNKLVIDRNQIEVFGQEDWHVRGRLKVSGEGNFLFDYGFANNHSARRAELLQTGEQALDHVLELGPRALPIISLNVRHQEECDSDPDASVAINWSTYLEPVTILYGQID